MRKKQAILSIDRNTCSLAAIKRAIYDFSEKIVMDVASSDSSFTICIFEDDAAQDIDITTTLLKCILEHELRIELEQSFGGIRQLIVEQALRPISSDALSKKLERCHLD